MNTQKYRGDILAKRIEAIMEYGLSGYTKASDQIKKALTEYRAPWTLADHMRRFFPTWDEATMPLHRNDFTEDMLPDGWRPLLIGEQDTKEDEYCQDRSNFFQRLGDLAGSIMRGDSEFNRRRTRRPLPEVKKSVPLGPEDMPPGSVIRSKGVNGWGAIVAVNERGIWTFCKPSGKIDGPYSFAEIMKDEISRDGGKTWQKCEKEAN